MKDRVLSVIGALLLFVCFCDHTFSFSIAGVNVRWSQLAGCAAAAAAFVIMLTGRKVAIGRLQLPALLAAWTPFTALFLISSFAGPNSFSSVIKLCWALSSIVGAFAIVASGQRFRTLFANGLLGAILLQSSVLVVDSLSICLQNPSQTLLGSAQLSYYLHNGARLLRPSAFYFEPSYFASMMSLALVFVLAALRRKPNTLGRMAFATGMTSLVLSTSRLGIISFFLLLMASLLPTRKQTWSQTLKNHAAPGLLSAVLLCLFLSTPISQPLRVFLFKTNGFNKIASVAQNFGPDGTFTEEHKRRFLTESEVSRYHAIEEAVASWKQSIWIGHGVVADVSHRYKAPPNPNTFDDEGRANKSSRFPSPSMTTWFELLEESGVLGTLAYFLALAITFRGIASKNVKIEMLLFITILFGLNYFLTPIFPRFDYWLLAYALLAIVDTSPCKRRVGMPA